MKYRQYAYIPANRRIYLPCESFGRFKDGTELSGETNNELTINSLTASNDGRYKCLAKSTASDTLPAAVSAEAQLSVIGKLSKDQLSEKN